MKALFLLNVLFIIGMAFATLVMGGLAWLGMIGRVEIVPFGIVFLYLGGLIWAMVVATTFAAWIAGILTESRHSLVVYALVGFGGYQFCGKYIPVDKILPIHADRSRPLQTSLIKIAVGVVSEAFFLALLLSSAIFVVWRIVDQRRAQ